MVFAAAVAAPCFVHLLFANNLVVLIMIWLVLLLITSGLLILTKLLIIDRLVRSIILSCLILI